MNRSYRWLAYLCFPIILACSSDDNTPVPVKGCNLDNPREELPWLKSRIDSMAISTSPDIIYCYVVQGTFEDTTVFRLEDCNPLIDKQVYTLDCAGNRLTTTTGFVAVSDLKNLSILWKPTNFACQVDF